MPVGYKQLLAEAEAEVTSIEPGDVASKIDSHALVVVDIRDPRELERDGSIPGAFHAPRGMLEFWIDPESPYHKPKFAEGKQYVFYCASGWRSLLAARLAVQMGLNAVSMRGGFGAWKTQGLPVEAKLKKT